MKRKFIIDYLMVHWPKKLKKLNRWYCKNDIRLNPILGVTEYNYAFQDMYDSAKYYEENFNITCNLRNI